MTLYQAKNIANLTVQKIVVFCLLVLSISSVMGQQIAYTHRYTIDNGLDQNSVRRILRDHESKTWIFSDNGVQIYDGSHFEKLNILDKINLDSIYQISMLDDGDIVLLGHYSSYKIHTSSSQIKLLDQSNKSFYYVSNGTLARYNKEDGHVSYGNKKYDFGQVIDLPKAIESDGTNILLLTDGKKLFIHNDQNIIKEIEEVNSIIGQIDEYFYLIKNDSLLYTYHPSHGLQNTTKKAKYGIIRHDKSGNSLLGLSDDPRRFKSFDLYTSDSIVNYDNIVSDLQTIRDTYADDYMEELLLASYNGLVYQHFNNHIKQLVVNKRKNQGRFGYVIWWIINRTKTNEIYFASEDKGVYKYNEGKVEKLFPNPNFPDAFESNFYGYYDEQEDIVLSSSYRDEGRFLNIWDFEANYTAQKVKNRIVDFLRYDNTRILLAGSIGKDAAISIYDSNKKTITKDYIIEELGSRIYSITPDGNDYLVGTYDGLYRIQYDANKDEKPFKVLKKLWDNRIREIKKIGDCILVGTNKEGVVVLKNDKPIRHLTTNNGLTGNTVASISIDHQNNIWIGTFKGISVMDSTFNILKNIKMQDGLSSLEMNTHSSTIWGDQVCLGSINGTNIINTDILNSTNHNQTLPTQIIYQKNTVIYSQNFNTQLLHEIPYDIDTIAIQYQDYKLYRSHLDNDYLYENTYLINETPTQIIDHHLPINTDHKSIEIKQIDNRGNQTIIRLEKQTFLQKYGLLLFSFLLIFILIMLVFWTNNKRREDSRINQVKELENKLEQMRSSSLRSQMNPHFIFNALGSIQYYIQRQETDLAEEYLSDFAILMRGILDSSKDDFIKISEEIDLLKLYVKLEHIRFDQVFDYTFDIDENLDMTLELPSMIIQPFLENAINHGLYHLDKTIKGKLKISMHEEEDDEQIICIIEDNGVGRSYSKKALIKKHKSRALGIINDRMTILSGQTNQRYKIDIIDLMEGKKPIGTRVIVRFGFHN